jgi:hypothetical protein
MAFVSMESGHVESADAELIAFVYSRRIFIDLKIFYEEQI